MTRGQTRIVIITAVVLGLFCLGMVFWALTRSPDPVAEPVPHPTTSAPPTSSTAATTTTTTTTTTEPPTTTSRPPVKAPVAPPKTTTRPPATTAPPATTVNGLCQADQWQRDAQYNGGALVLHNGAEWFARSWNYNSEPGNSADDVWVRAFNC
ncbi:hypothetical protein [Kutzneria sp. CA-103260]|uniref:hypothetical protein n=1 Tax=Kutzneria sp. CA-103260 TaxID=2802641 RepID=UPI001BA5E642|nr:hypothetical protein [Kutzneria sp. CA-103260]QUQ68626.1 hypothetical protein JJ691_63730 [Kutzneria sp. CA-103260]